MPHIFPGADNGTKLAAKPSYLLFLVPVLFAYEFWMSQRHPQFITCSAAAIILFRGELAVLLGLILLGELALKRVTVKQ